MKTRLRIILLATFYLGLQALCFSQTLKSGIVDNANPNLNPNWKWYENNGPLDMWYAGQNQIIPVEKPVYLPFFDGGEELCAITGEEDMYPEDGWMLVCRDFGTPNEAPDQPFFVLYNNHSGFLRFVFYNAQQTSYTLYKAELSFKSESQSSPLFTFTDENKPSLTYFDETKKEVFMGEAARFDGWFYADFHVFGYVPNFDNNTQLRIRVHGLDKSKISLEGDISLDQVLDDANLSASDGVGLSDLKKGVEEGAKQYKSAEKFVKGINDRVTKEKKKIDDGGDKPWWYDDASAITSVGKYIPYAGAIIGFINTAFFSDDPASKKPLKFEGSLTLIGTIETEQLLFAEDFIFNSNAPLSSDYYRVVQDIPIGIFNLVNPPILVKLNDGWPEEYGGPFPTGYTLHNPEYLSQKKELNYVLNPNCGLELVSMKAALVYENKSPTAWYEPELLTKITFQLEDEYPSGVALKLIFRTKSATRNTATEKTVLKVFPFGGTQDALDMLSYSFIRVGENLASSNFWGYQYHIAYNNITLNNGFSINVENSDLHPFYYFIAGNEIKFNPESNFLSNRSITFKIADFRDVRLKSSSIDNVNNTIENTLQMYEPEFINRLSFKNLRVSDTSKVIINSNNFSAASNKNGGFHIKVFPNPARDIVNISIKSSKQVKCNLFLYNSLGQNVYSSNESLQNGITEITLNISDINDLNGSDVLFYKMVTSDFNVYSGKILIKN